MKRIARVLAISGVLVLPAASAHACTTCMMAAVWTVFPPLLYWDWLGLVWMFVMAVLCSVWRQKNPFLPGPVGAAVILLFAFFAYFAVLGPVATYPLLVLPLAGAWSFLSKGRHGSPRGFRIAMSVVGAAVIGVYVVTGAREIFVPTPRAPSDVIIQWESSPSANAAFAELKRQEPGSADAYREIVRRGRLFAVQQAAQRLAVVGDRDTDVPLIIDALDRAQAQDESSRFIAGDLGDVLQDFTGLSLPKTAPAAEWRRAWAEQATREEQDN